MEKVIKVILLLLMTAVLAFGLHNLLAPQKDDNPVVDSLLGDEENVQKEVVTIVWDGDDKITIEVETGMTWLELLTTDENYKNLTKDFNTYSPVIFEIQNKTENDVISLDGWTYKLCLNNVDVKYGDVIVSGEYLIEFVGI